MTCRAEWVCLDVRQLGKQCRIDDDERVALRPHVPKHCWHCVHHQVYHRYEYDAIKMLNRKSFHNWMGPTQGSIQMCDNQQHLSGLTFGPFEIRFILFFPTLMEWCKWLMWKGQRLRAKGHGQRYLCRQGRWPFIRFEQDISVKSAAGSRAVSLTSSQI